MAKKANVRRPAASPAGDWPPNEAPFRPVNLSGQDLQDAADADEKRRAAVRRPQADGGEVNLAGTGVDEAARAYVELLKQEDDLAEQVAKLKKKMALHEDHLLECFAQNDVQSVNCAGKTIYRQEDTIVSKAKGISADEMFEAVRKVGWEELIGETINAQTLKATVKEAIRRAKDSEATGDQFLYCPLCSRFEKISDPGTLLPYKPANFTPKRACGSCQKEGKENPFLVAVIDGIPATLKPLLYIETKWKIGARASG